MPKFLSLLLIFGLNASAFGQTAIRMHQIPRLAEFKKANVVLLGEFHLNSMSMDVRYPEILSTFRKLNFDCLLLEMPKNVLQTGYDRLNAGAEFKEAMREANRAFWEASIVPRDWADPRNESLLDYRKELLLEARRLGFKIYAIDMPAVDERKLSNDEIVEKDFFLRNEFMAAEIAARQGECRKIIASVGGSHIHSRQVHKSTKRQAVPIQELLNATTVNLHLGPLPDRPRKSDDLSTYHYWITSEGLAPKASMFPGL